MLGYDVPGVVEYLHCAFSFVITDNVCVDPVTVPDGFPFDITGGCLTSGK
ncbi:MAG: hypothetical protein J7K26_01300 [Candidatus Aenigmarchaeota archaeon]|nr:hypothetical protein [Candidatus Aenigmarchaeota archaeon]